MFWSRLTIMLTSEVWIYAERLGTVGNPSTLCQGQRFRIAAMIASPENVVLLASENGEIHSFKFENSIALPVGAICRVEQLSDHSYTLVWY
jgi:hypothetical protein